MKQYILEVEWEVPGMPRLIGPFPTVTEAEEFASLNVPNGTAVVQELHYPYSRSGR